MKRPIRQIKDLAQPAASGIVRRVLVVSADAAQRRSFSIQLRRAHYEVMEADSVSEALQMCQRDEPDIVLADWSIPGPSRVDSGLICAGRSARDRVDATATSCC